MAKVFSGGRNCRSYFSDCELLICIHCRVVLRKQVHKKTVIRDGQEETLVTEDTHIEQDKQDSEGPDELRESVQEVIDRFMEVDENSGSSEAL